MGFAPGPIPNPRDDSSGTDVKWRLSDPDSPEDLNADYFQHVLTPLASSPAFTPRNGDAVGTAYEVDVTDNLQCIQQYRCANQGWALYHDNPDANIQHVTASSNYADSHYRPKLIVTYHDDTLEPLILQSTPGDQEMTSIDGHIALSLATNESAECRYDRSPLVAYADMRYQMTSTDGHHHHSQWQVEQLQTRTHLYGRCVDASGNVSRTPHVFTYTVTADQSTTPPGSGMGDGDGNSGGDGDGNSDYIAGDLLPGLAPTDVWKTLYTTTGNGLPLTLGKQFADDGSAIRYRVDGADSCKNSLVGNRCTFLAESAGTRQITVNYEENGVSHSRQLVVVSQPNGGQATTSYVKNKSIITPDYGDAPPAKGGSHVDPTTGATLTRLTDASEIPDSDDALVVYSRYSPENSTGDYLLVFGGNSTSSRVINRHTGALVTALTDSRGRSIGESHEVRWDTSGRHPNRIYYISGMKFYMIDDITDQAATRVLLKDFSPLFPTATKIYNDVEGDSSNDSDHWAWMAVHYGENYKGSKTYLVDGFIHYQVSTDTTHHLTPADLAGTNLDMEAGRDSFSYRPNMVEMSPLGTGVVLHFGRKWDDADYNGKGIEYVGTWFDGPHLWPLDFDYRQQAPVKISVGETHSGWSFDHQGREMFISQNNRTDKLDAIYIDGEGAGYDHRLEIASHVDFGWENGFHYGKMPPNRPGWAFISSYSGSHDKWGQNQFMMVQLKSEQQQPIFWRIAPTYTRFRKGEPGSYRDEAAAALNLSGNRIYWSSNWGGLLDHREVFMIELPDDWDTALLAD